MNFSRHVKNRMRKFRLTQKDVEQAVNTPDVVEDEIKGRKNAWKRHYDCYIKVTYIIEESNTIIITATLKEQCPKELNK